MIAGCGTLLPTRSMPSSIRCMEPALSGSGGHRRVRGRLAHGASSPCGRGWPSRSRAAGESRSRCSRRAATVSPGRLARCRRCRCGPRGVPADELLEEQRGGDRPGVRAAEVLDVGDVGVELGCGSGAPSGSCQTGSSVAIGGRADLVDQAERRCPSPRRPRCRAPAGTRPVSVAMSTIASAPLLGGQHERVGHHEPPLGVGVDDLDGRAAADGEHVAELHRRCRTACCRCTSGSR